ncbi:MAG: TonB family protein [Gallionella sp.]|nr:TonB family protein [Gallionella sp.]
MLPEIPRPPMPHRLKQTDLPSRDRLLVVILVVLVHVLLLGYWASLPLSATVHHEMSASFTIVPNPVQAAPQPATPLPPIQTKPKPKLKPAPVLQSKPVVSAELAEIQHDQAVPQPAAPAETISSRPAVDAPPVPPDREPDYRAAYLSNPVPAYPMVARRMGWQGKVVLNVEVLASGLPGQIKLHQSSGREVLDNAAANTVKNWRFVPAQRAGRAVTQWFRVPINFSLEDNET